MFNFSYFGHTRIGGISNKKYGVKAVENITVENLAEEPKTTEEEEVNNELETCDEQVGESNSLTISY